MTEARTNPLTVFIHVPKTGGTTINSYMRRTGRRGEDHIEAWINNDKEITEKLGHLEWVSGHVPINKMHERLSLHSFRPLHYYALLREPAKQIMSHYNWLIEIYHRGEQFYLEHPPRIRDISKEIRSVDNSNPRCIIRQLEKHADLFLNQQSRMVLGNKHSYLQDTSFIGELGRYNMVAVEEYIAFFVRQISGLPYRSSIRRNVSKYHFDRATFECSEIIDFLADKNFHDIELYNLVRDMNKNDVSVSGAKENRRRPWYLRF